VSALTILVIVDIIPLSYGKIASQQVGYIRLWQAGRIDLSGQFIDGRAPLAAIASPVNLPA
jgi:hypothetical protein